jgi:acyl dehydratase
MRPTVSLQALKDLIGAAPTWSEWHPIEQSAVNDFARVTGDGAFIHTDPQRAARTRFGGTIAHGLFTLSLLPQMLAEATPVVEGTRMGVNYGFDRVRFVAPVMVGSRVRAGFALTGLEERTAGFHLLSFDVQVAIDGVERPALTAVWLLGRWIRPKPATPVGA